MYDASSTPEKQTNAKGMAWTDRTSQAIFIRQNEALANLCRWRSPLLLTPGLQGA